MWEEGEVEISESTAPTSSQDLESFLCDLDRVHRDALAEKEPVPPVPGTDLDELASIFVKIKSAVITGLPGGENWLEKLPANDPLCSPVGLFGTLDLGLRETAHTRVLAWLMDPNKKDHDFGDTLLCPFLKQIFNMAADPQLFDVRVDSETVNDESRNRLDICMRGKWLLSSGRPERWLLIVEAKIDAGEGEDQCARYEKQCRNTIAASDRHALVFLTPDGRLPTTGSEGRWKSFTFIKLMALFRIQLPKLTGQPGFDILRHYMTGVLKDFYGLNCGSINKRDDIYRISEYLAFEINRGI